MQTPEYLYHGSSVQGLKMLEPQKRFTPGGGTVFSAIYATPIPAFAAAHAFPWSSDEGFDIDVKGEHIVLIVPREKKERLYIPISIYKLARDGFEKTKEEVTGLTWHTRTATPVLEEKTYADVVSALSELGGEVRYS